MSPYREVEKKIGVGDRVMYKGTMCLVTSNPWNGVYVYGLFDLKTGKALLSDATLEHLQHLVASWRNLQDVEQLTAVVREETVEADWRSRRRNLGPVCRVRGLHDCARWLLWHTSREWHVLTKSVPGRIL